MIKLKLSKYLHKIIETSLIVLGFCEEKLLSKFKRLVMVEKSFYTSSYSYFYSRILWLTTFSVSLSS